MAQLMRLTILETRQPDKFERLLNAGGQFLLREAYLLWPEGYILRDRS